MFKRNLNRNQWLLLLPPVVALYLILNLFTFSITPYLLGGDQTYFWTYALRLEQGQKAYRDFFQFTTPGTDYYYFALFRLFGTRIWVTDLAIILLGVALCWICFEIAAQIMDRSWALLATAFYLVFIYGRLLDATHHWFSLLAVACAVRVLMPERTTVRTVAAGASLAVACFFTQTAGVAGLVGLLCALAWERHFAKRSWAGVIRLQLAMVGAFALTFGLESVHFIASAGGKQLWYLWVIYAAKNVYYMHHFIQAGTHGRWPNLVQRLSLLIVLLCLYPSVWWLCWRNRNRPKYPQEMQIVLLSIPGFLLLFEVLSRPNWNRLYMISLPGILLALWAIQETEKLRSPAMAFLWTALVLSGLSQTLSAHRHTGAVIELPAGRALPVDQQFNAEFVWLSQHTKPGDLFLQAGWLNTYFPLKLQSPVPVDGVWPDERTPPEYVRLTMLQAERTQVKYILWEPQWIGPVVLEAGAQDSLGPFRQYVMHHYRRVQVFPNQDEVWQRQ